MKRNIEGLPFLVQVIRVASPKSCSSNCSSIVHEACCTRAVVKTTLAVRWRWSSAIAIREDTRTMGLAFYRFAGDETYSSGLE